MKKTMLKYFVELSGNPIATSILKTVTSTKISKPLIKPFSRAFQINENEMKYPIHAYRNLHAFFTRELKPGTRIVDLDPLSLTSPVDGIINGVGKIEDDQTFLIKNHQYNLLEILGDEKTAKSYHRGYYYIVYLSPSHYHRIHAPKSGILITRYTLGGKSYPVNDTGLKWGNQPFSTNYRSVSEYQTNHGKVAVVKVGALNINSIEVHQTVGDACEKGDEIGYFSFGSTVILFIEPSSPFAPLVANLSDVKMGQPIGKWIE